MTCLQFRMTGGVIQDDGVGGQDDDVCVVAVGWWGGLNIIHIEWGVLVNVIIEPVAVK